jgi:hypothetical protein
MRAEAAGVLRAHQLPFGHVRGDGHGKPIQAGDDR